MVTETSTQTRRVPSWQISNFDDEDEDDGYNYAKTNLYQPSSYTTTTEDEDEDEAPAFEVEKNYNNSYEDDEEKTKPEFVMAKKGLLEVDRPYVAETYAEPKTKTKLSARLKIALTVYSLVIALIIGFAIYNTVAISSLNGTINATNIEISETQGVIKELEAEYNELGTSAYIEDKVPDNYVEIVEGTNSFSKTAPILDAEEALEAETNWFDKICQFFSSLF